MTLGIRAHLLRMSLGILGCLAGMGMALTNQRSPWDAKMDNQCSGQDSVVGTAVWEEAPPAPWLGRSDLGAAVSDDGTLFIMGGQANNDALLRDVWSTVDGENWNEVAYEASWTGRKAFGMVTFNKNMWIAGGIIANGASNSIYSSFDGVPDSNSRACRAETQTCRSCNPVHVIHIPL
jgi:hypothetical protein